MRIDRDHKLKVGIILPKDNIGETRVQFSDPSLYEIETAEKVDPSCKTPESLDITVEMGAVFIKRLDEVLDDQSITLKGVPAGRGFHWQKSIDVSLPGSLVIKVVEDSLIVINEVPLEHYLACVAVSEMSAECPSAFLEAQMIAARSWVLANRNKKHPELEIDVCNDDCCQRYQGISGLSDHALGAAEKSAGTVLKIDGNVCDARYSKSCGGITEVGSNVWPKENLDYLVSVQDGDPPFCGAAFISDSDLPKYLGNVDESQSYFRWKFDISQEALTDHINKFHFLEVKAVLGIEKEKRGPSGRILSCELVYVDSTGREQSKHLETEYIIRKTLSPSFLFSSAFALKKQNVQKGTPGSFSLAGKGWGHGAGMCQIGALGMALSGNSSTKILSHYFKSTELRKIND